MRCSRAFQADGDVAESPECRKVTTRPAAEVENGERWRARHVAQQRLDVLTDIVILGAGAKILGASLVVSQGTARDGVECRLVEGFGAHGGL